MSVVFLKSEKICYIAQHSMSLFEAAILHWMAPLDFHHHSTPYFGAADSTLRTAYRYVAFLLLLLLLLQNFHIFPKELKINFQIITGNIFQGQISHLSCKSYRKSGDLYLGSQEA